MVDENPRARAIQIVVLAVSQCPEESGKAADTEKQRHRDQVDKSGQETRPISAP